MGDLSTESVQVLLDAFTKSTLQVFETMTFTPLQAGPPEPKKDDIPVGYISGTIGFNSIGSGEGASFVGSLSLLFPKNLGERIVRSMMMMGEADPVDAGTLKDAIGELANMSTGSAKAELQEKGLNYSVSLPIVVVGENHHMAEPTNAKALVISLKTAQEEEFFMEMSVS